MSTGPAAPKQRGRWAYTTADLRVLLVCARCGALVMGATRPQHNLWHDYIENLNRSITQPELFPTDDTPPPF